MQQKMQGTIPVSRWLYLPVSSLGVRGTTYIKIAKDSAQTGLVENKAEKLTAKCYANYYSNKHEAVHSLCPPALIMALLESKSELKAGACAVYSLKFLFGVLRVCAARVRA